MQFASSKRVNDEVHAVGPVHAHRPQGARTRWRGHALDPARGTPVEPAEGGTVEGSGREVLEKPLPEGDGAESSDAADRADAESDDVAAEVAPPGESQGPVTAFSVAKDNLNYQIVLSGGDTEAVAQHFMEAFE